MFSIYEQAPQMRALKKTPEGYGIVGDTIDIIHGPIGFGIEVNDYMNGSDNTLNFYTAKWYADDKEMGSIRLDDIGYEETRYLHAYADYKLYKDFGRWYQLLFQMPGNNLGIYTLNGFDFGDLTPTIHKMKIVLTDAAGNNTTISFYLENGVQLSCVLYKPCDHRFEVNKANEFSHPNVKFSLPATALYEWLCFDFKTIPASSGYSSKYELHHPYVPVHNYFDLYLKPEVPVPFALRDKMVLMYSDGKKESGKGTISEDSWYKASIRAFGTYWLAADTEAPVIKVSTPQGAVLSSAKSLKLSVMEKVTSVKSFRAELDGKWLLFEPTGNTYTYVFDARCPKGKHELVVTASDESGNIAKTVYHFTR